MISKTKTADYLDLGADVNTAEAHSELQAHLGTLDLSESVFPLLV